jgi:hypothetical protein
MNVKKRAEQAPGDFSQGLHLFLTFPAIESPTIRPERGPTEMRRKEILLICGSLNQTTMMHRIGEELARRHDCFFSPFYADGLLGQLKPLGLLDRTIIAGRFREATERYLATEFLPVDDGGRAREYDLVVTCSDLIVQRNIRNKPLVLVQEGMTDPDNFGTVLARHLRFPRWLGSTSTNGLSLAYRKFCVASDGYRDFFHERGVPRDRLEVTGIPNFDNCVTFLVNDFPHHGYLLAATSDTRETFKRDDRRSFISKTVALADGRPIIFKLHPNEDWDRSTREIRTWAPEALVLTHGDANHMVANCDLLVTQYSTLVFVGLILGKECLSYFDLDLLRRLLPLQNGGTSARAIAATCEQVLDEAAARAERKTA